MKSGHRPIRNLAAWFILARLCKAFKAIKPEPRGKVEAFSQRITDLIFTPKRCANSSWVKPKDVRISFTPLHFMVVVSFQKGDEKL
jgi:hypothetical protein